jgi:hypothetical protein
MKEKTRQRLLATGVAVTRAQALRVVASSKSKSWDGCLSGSDWCGTVAKVVRDGTEVCRSSKSHRQNSAPTGWERRGETATAAGAATVQRGDVLLTYARNCVGSNLDGDRWYKTTPERERVIV